MKWLKAVYKIGQVVGCGATAFIALWLIFNPWYEPHLSLRSVEIVGSLVAAVVIGADALDLNPLDD